MLPRAERAILVVGVGRSGTSLAMQALLRIGAGVSSDLVPASENNVRGAFEDVQIRNQMVALGRKLGHFREQMRPADWCSDPLSREVGNWLSVHLDTLAADCEQPVLAVKFPLASVYLPIWYGAAARIELPLLVIWATRNAQDTIASLIRAYDFDPEMAKNRYLQRVSQLMEDLRPDAFLLPYEGWIDDPQAQIRALADFAGLPLEDEAAALDDLFDQSINHGGERALPFDLDPITREVDSTVTGHLGTIAERIAPDQMPLRTLSRHVATAFAAASEKRAARDALASEKRAAHDALASEKRAAHDALAGKDAEIAELRAAYDALTRARDAEVAARDDRAAEKEAEIAQLRIRSEAAETLAKTTAGEVTRMRASRRWKAGEWLAQASRRPRWRDLYLPIWLVRSMLNRSR